MTLNLRRTFGASAVVVAMTVFAAVPASADDMCDLELGATVDGPVVAGDLDVSVTQLSGEWTYSVNTPDGYELVSVDGAFRVTAIPGDISIGGGVATRSGSISGDFDRITACFSTASDVRLARFEYRHGTPSAFEPTPV